MDGIGNISNNTASLSLKVHNPDAYAFISNLCMLTNISQEYYLYLIYLTFQRSCVKCTKEIPVSSEGCQYCEAKQPEYMENTKKVCE